MSCLLDYPGISLIWHKSPCLPHGSPSLTVIWSLVIGHLFALVFNLAQISRTLILTPSLPE